MLQRVRLAGRPLLRGYARNHRLYHALAILLIVAGLAVVGPVVWSHDPSAVSPQTRLVGPSASHPMGTDDLGRDVFARLMSGARVSLLAVLISVSISFVAGFVPGLIAGYVGGRADRLITRTVDGIVAIPPLILAITLVALLGPGLFNGMLAVGLVLAPRLLRVVRSAVLSVREELYVDAAITIGSSTARIVRKHIVRNVIGPTLVILSTVAGYAMFAEASLSFLGLGVQPPQASLGSMVQIGVTYLHVAPWLVYAPSLVIVVAVYSLNSLSDELARRRADRTVSSVDRRSHQPEGGV